MSINFIKSLYYELISYFIPQKIKYKIVGKCLKCGKCCKEIRSYGLRNEKELNFMKFIFPWYKRFYITNKDENGNLVLSCKHLTTEGLCSVYKLRPLLCRNYPNKTINFNAEMIDGCGFKVIKKEFKDYL
jgi:Fe-S-cluster containining protein